MAVGYGKLLLFGEHAAVYGHPAVGIRLSAIMEVSVEQTAKSDSHPGGDFLKSVPPSAAGQLATALEALPRVLAAEYGAACPASAREQPQISRIAGSLPMSMGFGSSAAFCTAIIRAVFPDVETHGLNRFWSAAHRLEHAFHGNPSGIDTGLSIFPGSSLITPKADALPERTPCRLPEATLVVGALRREKSTAQLIAGLRGRRDSEPEDVDRRLTALGLIARAAADAEGANALGAYAQQAHAHLRELGLSTNGLEEALEFLIRWGAVGAKLSGAGGGGAFFGVFGEEKQAKKTAAALDATAGIAFTEIIRIGPDLSGVNS